jgi:hypothetical protein
MKRKFISLTLSAVLVLGVTTPAWAAAETYTDGEAHTIVSSYMIRMPQRWKCSLTTTATIFRQVFL